MGEPADMAAKKAKMLEARGEREAAEVVKGDDKPETAGKKSTPAKKK